MVEAGNGGIYLIQLKYRTESEDILMNKVAKLLSFIIVLSMVVTHAVALPVEVNAIAMGQYIIGDGSGGGGGGGGGIDGGIGGNGGGGDDTITGTEANDVILETAAAVAAVDEVFLIKPL
jgi:hypothetical protein